MATVTETEPRDKMLSCTAALAEAYRRAVETLPGDTHGRLAKALTLVQAGQVFEREGGYWEVASQRAGEGPHSVNGACDCTWATYNNAVYCTHQLAVLLQRKTMRLLAQAAQTAPVPPAGEPHEAPTPEAVQGEPALGIDPKFLTYIHGRPHIRYQGLLVMAHAKGLKGISARFVRVTPEMALAEATVEFQDGAVYTEAADSTPTNVPAGIKAHWARLALTRAKARCLRDALNIGVAAVEELD